MAVNEESYTGFRVDPDTGETHKLRHLAEEPCWEPGIYLFENGDKLIGGENGIDNLPLLELANRTKFLYDANERMYAIIKALRKENAALKKLIPIEDVLNVTFAMDAPTDGTAWIQPETGPVPCDEHASSYIEYEDGTTVKDALAYIESEDGSCVIARTNYVTMTDESDILDADKDDAAGDFEIVNSDDDTEIEYAEGGGSNDEIVTSSDIDALFGK